MVVAIDGPAGTGKGTISEMIAKNLGYIYIDTGMMYRAITLKIIRNKVELSDLKSIEYLLNSTELAFDTVDGTLRIFMDGEDVSTLIRMPDVNSLVSPVSAIKIIRDNLVKKQRDLAKNSDVVMEGRDITTVVFSDADVKIYLTASMEERAKRRYNQMTLKGIQTSYEDVFDSIKARDENDMKKEFGALKIADDAVVIDSTDLTITEVYDKICEIITSRR